MDLCLVWKHFTDLGAVSCHVGHPSQGQIGVKTLGANRATAIQVSVLKRMPDDLSGRKTPLYVNRSFVICES